MCAYFHTKFQVFSMILTSFRQEEEGNFTHTPCNTKKTPKKPALIRIKQNSYILKSIKHHIPLKRTKFIRPPAPWMNDLGIVAIRNQRDKLKYKAHSKRTISNLGAYREIRSSNQTENKYN